MSFKGKGLSYEAQEPAFLRRMRAQQAGVDTDRHEQPIARPHRVKVNHDDDEGPTYVDEASNDTLSKEQYEVMMRGVDTGHLDATANVPDERQSLVGQVDSATAAPARSKQEVTEVGQTQRKRKTAKAIGQSQDEDQDEHAALAKKERNAVTKRSTKSSNIKKPKAIKLSFGTDE